MSNVFTHHLDVNWQEEPAPQKGYTYPERQLEAPLCNGDPCGWKPLPISWDLALQQLQDVSKHPPMALAAPCTDDRDLKDCLFEKIGFP